MFTKKQSEMIYTMAAAGATDSEIDKAVLGGKKVWATRDISYTARRDAGLIPTRVGQFEDINKIKAADVKAVLAESPKLRAYALPIVFGFKPTAANVKRLGKYTAVSRRPGRLAHKAA